MLMLNLINVLDLPVQKKGAVLFLGRRGPPNQP